MESEVVDGVVNGGGSKVWGWWLSKGTRFS